MDRWLQFKLLTINAFRILWKSKVLVSQLMLLLLIGITVLATIVLSNNSLEASKSAILNNGNIANFTVTIPDEYRSSYGKNEDSNQSRTVFDVNKSNDDQAGVSDLPGNTPADIQLKNELDSLGLQYSLTKTTNLSDVLSGNSFILANAQFPNSIQPEVINSLVLDKNSNKIPNLIYTPDSVADTSAQYNYFYMVSNDYYETNDYRLTEIKNAFNYQEYMAKKPWNFAKLVLNSIWNLDVNITKNLIKTVEPLAKMPQNQNDYDLNYNIFDKNGGINKNSYWLKWRELMGINDIKYTGYGYSIGLKQNIPLLGKDSQLPFTSDVYDLSSYFAIASSNFINANKGKKSFIPQRTLEGALQLPFKSYISGNTSSNPSTITKVYNPDTGVDEPQTDFVSWVANLNDKYKIQVNSMTYVLVGSGMTPNIMYPVLNSNQLLVNSKNSGVLYMNDAGFSRATFGTSNTPEIYYSVRFPPDLTTFEKSKLFSQVQKFTTETYGHNTAYYLNDPKQPNYVIYLRANFLNNLQTLVLVISLIIALIIGFLSLFFISTLLRSIIKQSKVTFGVGLANGISKLELALSFFPFALIPSVFCGIVGYLISFFLTTPMNNVYTDYWTVSIPAAQIQWWLFLVIPIIVFIILYTLNIAVSFWTLRKNTQTILNSSSEFRMNWFITHTKWITSKLSAIGSFRITFMMGNITRFIILTCIVFAFVALSSITVGTIFEFQNALSYTERNKQYNYAFDLYTPTISNGYYSAMPYDQIGLTTQGMYNNYTTYTPFDGNYAAPTNQTMIQNGYAYTGAQYANALQYPYANQIIDGKEQPLYFTSLFMPSTKVATELNGNIQFFNNKVFTKLDLDLNVDIAGALINPWDVAKQIAPQSVISMSDNYLEKQIQINYDFYYWLQQANSYAVENSREPSVKIPAEYTFNDQPIFYSTYLPNVNSQPFTLDGSDLTDDYDTAPNKDEWIFTRQVNQLTNKEEWIINQNYAITGAPLYQAKVNSVRLFVQILTNNDNLLFQYWYKYIYDGNPNKGKENQQMPNLSYKLANGVVPVEDNDETYTYINGDIVASNGKEETSPISAKIMGIKPNSKFVTLYGSNDQDLKSLLNQNLETDSNNEVVYPLIINEVVAKKYGFKLGSILDIRANNTYDRFSRQNMINTNGAVQYQPWNQVKFKVVGITTSKSEEQYYTTQEFANKILGFQDFSNAENTQWKGPKQPGRGYIPFNGVFTGEQLPELALNFGGVYAPSGLTTSKGAWNTNIGSGPGQSSGAEQTSVILNNWNIINEITAINYYVDRNDGNKIVQIPSQYQNPIITQFNPDNPSQPNPWNINDPDKNIGVSWMPLDVVGNSVRHIANLWQTTLPIVTQLQNVDSPYISMAIGPTIDTTLANIESVVMICVIPTLIIIIGLLASMIIVEARRLISLMKVLGYTDLKNAFSFMFVYVVVLFLGTLLAVPFTYGVLAIVKLIAFSAFNIIVAPLAPVWIYFTAFGVVALVFVLLFLYVWNQLKKINLPQEISVR